MGWGLFFYFLCQLLHNAVLVLVHEAWFYYITYCGITSCFLVCTIYFYKLLLPLFQHYLSCITDIKFIMTFFFPQRKWKRILRFIQVLEEFMADSMTVGCSGSVAAEQAQIIKLPPPGFIMLCLILDKYNCVFSDHAPLLNIYYDVHNLVISLYAVHKPGWRDNRLFPGSCPNLPYLFSLF